MGPGSGQGGDHDDGGQPGVRNPCDWPEVFRFTIRMKLDVSSSESSKLNFSVQTVGPCKWIKIYSGGGIKTTRKDLAKQGLTLRLEEVKG